MNIKPVIQTHWPAKSMSLSTQKWKLILYLFVDTFQIEHIETTSTFSTVPYPPLPNPPPLPTHPYYTYGSYQPNPWIHLHYQTHPTPP